MILVVGVGADDEGVAPSASAADERYEGSRALRAWLEERQVHYVMAIPKNEVLPLADGRTQEARQLLARALEALMERRSGEDRAKGPRANDFAVVDLAGTSHGLAPTLLIRRSPAPNKKNKDGELVREVAYFLCRPSVVFGAPPF
ncbi:hypothetical protein ACH4Y0_02370 [Streptomyces sp. NPDC020707]|uniref:hypothetical protein n=1 Tax=Streptomyces sp. NPDC020707 TaxID=3365084 RepID=UPI00378D0E9F